MQPILLDNLPRLGDALSQRYEHHLGTVAVVASQVCLTLKHQRVDSGPLLPSHFFLLLCRSKRSKTTKTPTYSSCRPRKGILIHLNVVCILNVSRGPCVKGLVVSLPPLLLEDGRVSGGRAWWWEACPCNIALSLFPSCP